MRSGVPRLFAAQKVGAQDRWMRRVYDLLSPVHDPLTEHLLPLLQDDAPDRVLRTKMVDALGVSTLRRGDDGAAHILEVGVGAGANLPFVACAVPPGLPVVYWALDLSSGMLRRCQARLPVPPLDVRLVQADAAALPFPDGCMQRVLHVGALGTFADPGGALGEMARVCAPGGRVVAVDEQLDEARTNRLRHRLAFRALTPTQPHPRAPVDQVPPGMSRVMVSPLSRFFYLLSFERPAAP